MSNSSLPSSVLTGSNPATYDKNNPILIFIIQATVVIIFCRILHFPLQRLRQPRVIAEVVGGILLGPTAFGRIPRFTTTIFPTLSMPAFNLVANLGLVLFLFIVGVEVDLRLVKKNARVALSVGAASLALPFAFGCLIAWALHKEYGHTLKHNNFGVFLLFIGTQVAFSITAFPVLARILTELKLLRQDVGVTVLAAGVGNDVVGWILLALTVALVNSATGLTAFYVILLVIAWCLTLFLTVRPAYAWLVRKSSSESGPSDTMMMLTILLVLISAFYTEIIGVHPIFGAFLVGLIIPHENGYAVSLTEKIEDIVSVLFLPLYFASSGLKTNIGLLNDGKTWGYTIAIIICATASKVAGSMLAARLNGFLWRESLTIGTLMSCKGLVELIVLNVGLSAGILTTKLFTMFVVMALVTTFITTPLTLWFYPPAYQQKVGKWRRGECDWEGNQLATTVDTDSVHAQEKLGKVTMIVTRLEGVSSMLRFTHFLSRSTINLHLLRIMEMTDRLSQIIKVSESDDLLQQDPLLSIFKTVTKVVGVKLSYSLQVLATFEYADTIQAQSIKYATHLTVAPWAQTVEGEWRDNEYLVSLLERQSIDLAVLLEYNAEIQKRPLRRRTSIMDNLLSRTRSDVELQHVQSIVEKNPRSSLSVEKVHFYLPLFRYGKDERLALLLLDQLLEADHVSATIRVFKSVKNAAPSFAARNFQKSSKIQFSVQENSAHDLSRPTTQTSTSLVAEAEPDIEADLAELESRIKSRSNSTFEVIAQPQPLEFALEYVQSLNKTFSDHTITTLLARSADDFTSRQASAIMAQQEHSNQGRGDVVEVFAAHRDRCGPIVLVSAKLV